jgi:hypothetical protein
MSKKDVKRSKTKCAVCGKKYDLQNYLHHHKTCEPKQK